VRSYEELAEIVHGRTLPLVLVLLDELDRNARALARRAAPKPIRLATKSVRVRALVDRVLATDGYRGLLAYHAREAAWLAREGAGDLVVAYPTVERADIDAVLAQVERGKHIALMVDAREHVRAISDAARAAGVVAELAIDVDMSLRLPSLHFGVRRSPLREVDAALALARAIEDAPGVRLTGVMGYEAQIAGLADAGPRGAVVRALKRLSIRDLSKRRGAVVGALRDAGHALEFVNGGGTGSLETTSADPSVTEVSAGSGLFSPSLFDGYRAFRHEPALLFALPITRRPSAGIATCFGGGYIASGSGGADRLPVPWLPEGCALLPYEGAGEVQTPITLARDLPIGAPIFFRHAKAGEICERFERVLLVEGDRITGEAPTYRGEGHAFG
jgi:D-serine deaminase-like pyridoxal phosphate-dependent protein